MVKLDKHVWEGWTVGDFVKELESILEVTGTEHLKNKTDLKRWCMDNQPYYKKEIPEVVEYLANKYNIK